MGLVKNEFHSTSDHNFEFVIGICNLVRRRTKWSLVLKGMNIIFSCNCFADVHKHLNFKCSWTSVTTLVRYLITKIVPQDLGNYILKARKSKIFSGLCPGPRWGAYSAPQTPSCKLLAPRATRAPLVSLASLA